MELHEYTSLDAVGLRALIRDGQVTPAEVESVARRAVAVANADLNAITGPLFEPALGHDPEGALGGVPFLIKDSGPVARGVGFASGSRGVIGAVAAADHGIMTRFRAAGLVTLGQSTAPEFSFSFATESARFGITRNPWALDRGAGGSSGGAAALVASGAVPLAHGNDGAGSLRVPASCCGLVGLKPSRGRTPGGPLSVAGADTVVEFGLSRSVRDTAHLLDAVASDPVASPRYAEDVRVDPGRLRIALTTEAWSGVAVDDEVAAVTVAAGLALDWIGHHVVEASPALDADWIVEGELLAAVAAGRAVLDAPVRPDPAALQSVSRRLLEESAAFTAADLEVAADARRSVIRVTTGFFDRFDLLVTPTIGQLPAHHGSLDYDDSGHTVRSWLRRLFEYGPFTAAFNLSGHPAISLPLGESRTGLPIGVQLVAASGRDDLLMMVAAQLEQAMPWKDRQPSVFVD